MGESDSLATIPHVVCAPGHNRVHHHHAKQQMTATMKVHGPAACIRPLPQFAVARTPAAAEPRRRVARDATFASLHQRRRPPVRAVGDGGEGSSSEPEEWTEEAVDRMLPRAPALVDQAEEPPKPQYRTRKDKARAKRKQKQADAAQAEANGVSAPAAAAAAAATPPIEKPPPLTGADRFQVLEAALNTSLVIALVAVVGRQGSHLLAVNGVVDGAIPDLSALIALQAQQGTDTVVHVLMGAGVAAAVTVARVALLQRWPEFKQATDASNSQVLTPLEGNVGEIAQVAVFPALSEELLFRGCLLPAVGMNPMGVVVAGGVFGALHIPGNRNAAFGLWAACVGCAYGALAVYTKDLAAPMTAHMVSNLASALYWQSTQNRPDA